MSAFFVVNESICLISTLPELSHSNSIDSQISESSVRNVSIFIESFMIVTSFDWQTPHFWHFCRRFFCKSHEVATNRINALKTIANDFLIIHDLIVLFRLPLYAACGTTYALSAPVYASPAIMIIYLTSQY